MNIFQALIRFFIAITVVLATINGNIEYSGALFSLSGIYFLSYLLVPKNPNTKYLFLLFDILFISISTYLTGYVHLSLLTVPLFVEFVRNYRDTVYFLALSCVPLFVSSYVSYFSEFTFLTITLSGLIGIYGLYHSLSNIEKQFKEAKNEMENLYIKNISYQEKINQQDKILKILKSLNKMREEKIPLKLWIYDINEILGTDGIVYFDLLNSRCYSTEKVKCEKDALKIIEGDFQFYHNHDINRIFNAPYVCGITIGKGEEIDGVLFFVSKLKPLNPETVKIIKDQLDLYMLELSAEKISQKDSSITASRQEETDSN
ncbi:hypothetical protein GWK41_04670 [Persephonella atlantica]|uniref:GAF domain-containing protein n=1 Tax=Persephonella atlantica TaxID=2699429 RepID=A0ABS1GHK2_9AQUI|nr:hypothetical protein [Persephonella atlantica]MBK3332360.1 hypothetical protein [Persephonella atlantica]